MERSITAIGLRRQSGAVTALSNGRGRALQLETFVIFNSGLALRLPSQS
jgi:hypothetical protein